MTSAKLVDGHPYFKKTAVLTTKHQKQSLIAPVFLKNFSMKILEHEADTDKLGTFSGDIARIYPPLETAILKAKIGMKETGLTLGLASEGSIGPDPMMPFVTSNIEYLVLVDGENDLVISEAYRSFEITAGQIVCEPGQDISEFLQQVDFPQHQLIATPNTSPSINAIKGIGDFVTLQEIIQKLAKNSNDGFVLLQSDLRAHCSPSRQKNIREAANLLAQRVISQCHACLMPGWGLVGYERGLACSLCRGEVAKAIKRKIFGCAKCGYREYGEVLAEVADPAHCDWCNP